MEKYEKIKAMISKFRKAFVCDIIHCDKLNKDLMFVYLKKSKHEILVFDSDNGPEEIAKISYAFNDRGVFISDLIVEEEYQRKGIGKSLFIAAMTHGAQKWSKIIYGYISPVGKIKGVSDEKDEFSFIREINALIGFYLSLGCEVFEDHNNKECRFVKSINKIEVDKLGRNYLVEKIISFENQLLGENVQ